MIINGPLWKNIGKIDSQRSIDSSISSGGGRPVKAFHIMFEDEIGSKSEIQSEIGKKGKGSHFFQPSDSIKEEDQLDASPMIITQDRGYQKPQTEEVLQVISFDSASNIKTTNMNNFLKSMSEVNEHPQKARNSVLLRQMKSKLAVNLGNLQMLKRDFQNYRLYLLNIMSEWEVQAINAFKNMKDGIDRNLIEMIEQAKKSKHKNLDQSGLHMKCQALQQQINILNKNLASQREALESARRQHRDREQRFKKNERAHLQQKQILGNEQNLTDQLKSKVKKLEFELRECKIENESLISKANKLKEVIRERDNQINLQYQEANQLQSKIKELKMVNQQSSSKARKFELQLKTTKDRITQQSILSEKELQKSRSQSAKLKSLLKSSEQQFSQCQDYINKLNNQVKDLQIVNANLHEKVRQNEMQYYKKLQQCDKYLLELQNSVKQLTITNQYRHQEFEVKQRQLLRKMQQLQNRHLQLKNQQYEIQEIKKQYQHKILSLNRREDGLKAEYKMAVEAQNAVKDKWYQRYYMLSPDRNRPMQDHRSILSPPHRDVNIQSPRTSFTRKQTIQIPTRQALSPTKQWLTRAKSQKNISLNTYRSDIVSVRSEMDKPQAQKDFLNLGSRINTLRRQLTRQLGNIGYKN